MKNTLRLALLACPFIAATMTAKSPDTIADSVREFSGTQGQNGWYYGYWDQSADVDGHYDPVKDFQLFKHFGTDSINGLSKRTEFTTGPLWYLEDGRYYTSLWAEGGHPHGSMDLSSYARADQWVVRRWISNVSGQLDISGQAGKVMPWGEYWRGNFKFLIVAGDEVIFETTADQGSQAYAISTAIEVGTPIDFLIGPGTAIGVIQFTAMIKSVTEHPME